MTVAASGSVRTSGTWSPRTRRLRPIRGAGVGGATLVVLYALLSTGAVPPAVAGVLPLALMVVVPTCVRLARRVAVNGLMLLALAPCLWWFRWPSHVDHGAALVSAGIAGVSGWVLAGRTSARTLRLVPLATRTDLLVAFAALLAVFTTHRWWAVGTPHQALTVLLRGYDNTAHFDIFSKMLGNGATLDSLGRPPDGSAWALVDYPQGFHAVGASYSELISPGTSTGPGALVAYSHCIAAVVVLGTVILAAALCSLPGLRARPLVAAPTLVAVMSAFLWGPGAKVLLDGFVNFWLAADAGACALALALDAPRRLSPVHWAALGAAFVVIAHTWAPLLILAGPAAAVALPVSGDVGPSNRRCRALVGLVAVLTALGILRAALMLARVAGVEDVVTAHGGITSPSPVPTMILVPLSLIVFVEFRLWVRRSPNLSEHAPRATVVSRLSLTTLVGLTSLVALLMLQLRSGGVGYYFFKYLVGFELVVGAATAAAAGVCIGLCAPVLRRRSRRAVLASLAVCLLATQVFGRVGWREVLLVASPPSQGIPRSAPPSDVAAGILAASSRVSVAAAPYTYYLAPASARTAAGVLPAVWVHALKGGLTTREEATMGCLVGSVEPPGLSACARRILDSDARARLLVRPGELAALRSALGPALAARVRSWPRSD